MRGRSSRPAPRMPSDLRLVLATRGEVRLGLHRLWLEGKLTEIRAEELRFSLEEVAVDFAGSERTVAEYPLAEVLERQPEEVRRLLLRTSVLERVSGPLADLLAGGNDGQCILQELEESGGFVVSLDQQRSWFRYHRLFAEGTGVARRAAASVVGFQSARAAAMIALAARPASSRNTSGLPSSAAARNDSSSGTLASNGTRNSAASCAPPPEPKIAILGPPCGGVNAAMFSITPATSSPNCAARSAERTATVCAAGCGVVMSRKRASGRSSARVIETSPVPGGRSTNRKSSSPHSTSATNCRSALWSIGPRHTIARLRGGRKNPIEITTMPSGERSGAILSPCGDGSPSTPSIRGIEYPYTSASITPTR